ncbi:MAG: T9SS type A sorting domain-containing protein [Bacteroidota bacterium]
MGGYESLPNPVPAAQMTYQNVGRALLGGWDGSAGSLPATIAQGSNYTRSYTHTLPAAQDENEIVIVGMVIDQSNGAIINAVKRDLMTIGVKEIHNGSIILYPNPTTGKINIKNADNATIIVYNSLGQIVTTADNTSAFESFDLSAQPNGTYIVKIITNDSIVTEKFIINK